MEFDREKIILPVPRQSKPVVGNSIKNSYNTTEKKKTKLIFIKKVRRELNNPKFAVQPRRQDAVPSPQWPVHLAQLSTLLRAVTGTAM